METKATSIKFTFADYVLIEQVQERHGLHTMAGAIRYALTVASMAPQLQKKNPKKSKKTT